MSLANKSEYRARVFRRLKLDEAQLFADVIPSLSRLFRMSRLIALNIACCRALEHLSLLG